MADEKSPLPEIKPRSFEELTDTSILQGNDLVGRLEEIQNYRDRNTVGDAAVGILDTLQSIGSIPVAALPGYGLENAATNSQFLDQFRSPAYLQERIDEARNNDPNASLAEGFVEGVSDALSGGNLTADVLAQVPYLMIGPAARAMGTAAATKVPGVIGRAATAVAGTGEAAVVNRIALLSGGLEGAGAYGQTYQRALEQTGDPAEAERQAMLAGAFSAGLGAILGKVTPGFELDPLGKNTNVASQFLGDAVAPTLTAVGAELVEEGGMAVGQTVADNILAGKDPMEGVGQALGEAAVVSSVFTGGIRTPSMIRDSAKAIGQGVRQGINALAARAVTPEGAATAAAAAATDVPAPPTQEEVIQSTEPVAAAPTPEATDNTVPSTDNIAVDAVMPPVLEPVVERRQDSARRKAIDELSPEEKDVEIQRLRDAVDNPPDAVTGLIRSDTTGDDANTPVQRALSTAVEQSAEKDTHWVSFDVANLGGLNDAVNNVAADANVHYRALVDIARNVLTDAGLVTQGFRTGGDEFGMVVQGDIEALNTATAKINEQVAAYTKANNLDQIPHPKGKAPGLNLHIGSTQVVPGDTVDTIRNRADRALDASKKGQTNVGRESAVTPREDARNERPQEDSGTGSAARPEVRGAAEAAPAKAAKVKPKKEKKPLQKKLPLRARRKSRAKSTSDAVETVLTQADLFAQAEQATGEKQAELLSKAEELAPFAEKATETVNKITDDAVSKYVEKANEGDEQAALVVEAVAQTDISRLPDEVIPDEVQPVVRKIRELKDTKVNSTTEQIMTEGFSGQKNSRGIRGYMQDIVNAARNGGSNESATSMSRFVAHLTTRAAAFQAALKAEGDNVAVEGTRTRDSEGKLTDKPFIIHKNSKNSMATVERVLEDAKRAQEALDVMKESFPEMFEEAPVADASAPAAPTPRVAPVAEQSAPDELSLVDEETPPPPQEDFTDNAPGEAGLFPDQYKMPNSTRIESETGLIDVDMTGDTWKITNTFTPPAARKTGAGRARMLQVAQMAAAAGKRLNGDDSVHPSALRMNLRMVDNGMITAEFDRAAVEETIANNSALRREGGVFRNIRPAEPVKPQAEMTLEERLQDPETLDGLERMGRDARWDERGGGIIRESEDYKSPVVGRLKWLTSAEWWSELPRDNNDRSFVPLEQIPALIAKARTGARLGVRQKAVLKAMIDWMDRMNAEFDVQAEQAPDITEATELPPIIDETTPVEVAPPTPVVNALAAETGWISPVFGEAFKIDPETSIGQVLGQLSAEHKTTLRRATGSILQTLGKVLDTGVAKITPRLDEALSKPWGVAAHALVRDANGKLIVQPQIRQALAIAAAVHALRAPTKYNESSIVVNGQVNRAATPQAWAREIARDTMLLLGIKPNLEESESITQGTFLSLALGAVQAIIDDGEVKLEKIQLADGRDFNVLIPSEDLRAYALKQMFMVDSFGVAVKGERELGASLTPVETVPERVNYSQTPISESQTIALKNRQKVPHYLNPTLVKFIQKIGAEGLSRLLTGAVIRDDMPQPVKDILEAQQEGLGAELNAANTYSDMINNDAEVPLFWEYGISVNGRSTSRMGPQGYKLLRDLFSSARVTLDLSDENQANALKMAIAQALGSKTDVQSPEAVLADYAKLEALWGEKAKALANALDTTQKVYPLLERGTPYSPRELNAILTMGRLLNHDGKSPFENYLAFEIDGKTNGAFNTEILFGLATITPANIEQGGMFLGKENATWGDEFKRIVKQYGSKDLYERVARTAIPLLKAHWDKALKKGKVSDVEVKQAELLLALSGMLSRDPQPVFLRDAAKRASNPIVYGAGVGGTANQLKAEMKGNIVSEWLRLDYEISKDPTNTKLRLERDNLSHWLGVDEFMWDTASRAAAEALLEAYKAEKPVVTAVTAMMVKITNLGYAIKQAQWENAQLKALPETERNKALIEKYGETNAQGRRINKFALSRKQYQRINRNTLSMTFSTAASEVGINLDDVENRPDTYRVPGFGTSMEAALDLPQPAIPGVRVLALLTQGAGDGAMVNELMQQYHAITDVFDGIEWKVTEFMEGGAVLNKAVWDTLQHDILADFVKVAESIATDMQGLTPEQQQLVIDAYNSSNPNPKAHITKFSQFAGEAGVALVNIKKMHAEQLAGLAKLNSEGHTVLQMGGGQGYTTAPTDRAAVARSDYRKGWNKPIEVAFDLVNGVMDRGITIATLNTLQWKTPVQRMAWKRIRNLLPAGLTVQLAKNEAEWNAMLGDHAIKRPYGSVNGLRMPDGRILLATTSPEIVLHELMHAVFSDVINQYFNNISQVPVELRTPINDLVQLLERFKGLNGNESVTFVQAVLRRLEFVGDTAAAVDEMLTYVMSEEKLIEELSPGLFTRIITRAKQILWGLMGKDMPSTFLEDALKTFASLTAALEGSAAPLSGVERAAINQIEVLTESAFAGLAQKIARGQHYNTQGVVNQSHLQQIETAYNLSPEQQRLFKRVFMLLRIETRPGELEQFVSTTLPHHPQKNLFNGAKDVVASVMALAAVDDSFKTQLELIWNQQRSEPKVLDALLDKALNASQHADVDSLLASTFRAMAEDAETEMSLLGTALRRGDRLGNAWLEKIGEGAFQAAQNAPRGIAEILLGINALTTETGSTAFAKTLIQGVNTLTDQRWLQDLTAALVGSQEDTNTVYRQVNEMKSNIAQTRSLFTITLPLQLKKLFPAEFDGWNNLFSHFGRLDASVLGAAAGEMYADDAARARMITALKAQVNNWVDAENLGYYLAHGNVKPGSSQPLLRNARAIADNLNGAKQVAPESLVADVDQLVTLFAIDALTPSQRATVAGYYRAHPEAMNNLSGMLAKVNAEDVKAFREEYRYTYWKGNLPLSTDPRTSVVLAGSVKGAALEALGYTKGKRYDRTIGDPANDLHYYTRHYAPPPAFTQGILSTVQQTAMGINYTSAATITPEVGTMITSPRLVRYIQNNQGRDSTLVPVFNFEGDIVAYERLLDQKLVQEVTKANNTQLHVAIGHKLGRILEERMAVKFNQAAVKILTDQWEQGQRDGAQDQYEAVNSSTDKTVARAWEVIPANTKRMLEEAFGGPVMIRKDLLANTLGYHKAGVGDIFTGDAALSTETRKAIFGLAQTILGPSAAKVLYAAESAIKEGVSTAKDWIIVRSMSVAINNAMSSINLVIANGVPLSEIVKYYREGLRDIREYGRLQRQIIELTVEIAGATDDVEKKRLRTLQDAKREAVKRLAIYPLIEAGDLNDLPEGLEEGPSDSYLGDFAGWLNNHLKKIHPKTPMVVANLAIAKDSEFHNAMSKAIQAGDFLGRWAVYKHMIKTGATPDVARDTVRDEFVSYTTNPGRFRGALEDFGLVWWTQFTIRAQKVLLRRVRRNPFSFFVSQLGAEAGGTAGPAELAITERGWDNSTGLDQAWNAPSAHIWSKIF